MTAPPVDRPRIQRATSITMVARAVSETLPAGVVGQVEGVALVYDVLDTWGTTFTRGCLERTIRERVAAGKVKLYWDHGDAALTGSYDTHLHIGTVRKVWDAQLPDGNTAAMFRADLFDTEPGREAHEYLRAVAATGSETGVSIGMMTAPETTRAVIDGVPCERIREVPLREISITGESSVPGTRVTHVRSDLSTDMLLQHLTVALKDDSVREQVRGLLGDAQPKDSDAASDSPAAADSDARTADSQPTSTDVRTDEAPMAERLAFARAAFARLYQ